jgi:hypothetical protein
LRTREHLTEAEVEPQATMGNRQGHRDTTMVLVAYRTATGVCWDQMDFRTATMHVRRVKKGTPSTHPIIGDELRALRLSVPPQHQLVGLISRHKKVPYLSVGISITMILRSRSQLGGSDECAGPQGGS